MVTVGRELDLLVAEKVFGWERSGKDGYGTPYWIAPGGGYHSGAPNYSTDIAAAWLVVDKAGVLALYKTPTGWRAVIGRGEWTADANLPAEAICLAALRAERVDV